MDLPVITYESNGRKYEASASNYSRQYSIGDGEAVSIEFTVYIIDTKTNMKYAEVIYRYSPYSTSFSNELLTIAIAKNQKTIDNIVQNEGCFIEPELPDNPLVLNLLDSLVEYIKESNLKLTNRNTEQKESNGDNMVYFENERVEELKSGSIVIQKILPPYSDIKCALCESQEDIYNIQVEKNNVPHFSVLGGYFCKECANDIFDLELG